MMKKIKIALAFLWGTVFGISLLYSIGAVPKEGTPAPLAWVVAFIVLVLTLICVGWTTIDFFCSYWDEE
jgi:NhaP-type Na+/H+ or K+/H+ antiporter